MVDEVTTENAMEGTHFLELRGVAERVPDAIPADGHLSAEVIRIHPTRVIGWNISPDGPVFQARDLPGSQPGLA